MPDRSSKCEGEVGLKTKLLHDPLTMIKKYTDEMKPKPEPLTQKSGKHVFPITSYSSAKSTPKHNTDVTKRRRSSDSSDRRHKKKKHKKHKSSKKKDTQSSDDTSEDEVVKQEKKRKLEFLRMQRLAREREEHKRTQMLFAKINGVKSTATEKANKKPALKQKYNSQFNPEIAKQNYD